jgi:hypothetical protein
MRLGLWYAARRGFARQTSAMNPETTAETAFSRLVAEARELVRASDRPLDEFWGTALFDTERDERIRGLGGFANAAESLRALPEAGEHFPIEEVDRIALQFIYAALRSPNFADDPALAAQDTWRNFRAEADVPIWTFRGVANLEFLNVDTSDQGFQNIVGAGASDVIRLTDEVIIAGRSETTLGPLGCGPRVLESLFQDWGGFGASSFVMVADSIQPKSPETFILGSDGRPLYLALTVINAMRLVAPGHVGVGSMYLLRPSHFDVGIGGGIQRTGWPRPPLFGITFELTPALVEPIAYVHGQLKQLEQLQNSVGPQGLPLAIRYFSASYERRLPSDAVVDLVTSLEAILGTDVEITYRLSMRVAQILAASDAERVQLFRDVKRWYALRSKLVHGGEMKQKEAELLADPEPLREIVRQLLRGFLGLSVVGDSPYDKEFFKSQLDVTLLSLVERGKLRTAMRLTDPS